MKKRAKQKVVKINKKSAKTGAKRVTSNALAPVSALSNTPAAAGEFKNLVVLDHPLVQDKLTQLRDRETSPEHFRRLVIELSQFLIYEMSRQLKTREIKVETPLQRTKGRQVAEKVTLLPILRAGLAMMEGALKVLPSAAVGHIGIYRDKFVQNTVEYYFRLPNDVEGQRIVLLDPMLATGDTMAAALTRLKERKIGPISVLTILVSRPGLEKVLRAHPDIEIYTLSLESQLDKNGYILPGVGDAGDRIYGTIDVD